MAAENVTHLSVSASMGRIGPISSVSGGIAADLTYVSGPRGPPPRPRSNEYTTYVWQAVGLASALAVSPFLLYGVLKASTFLCHHLRIFGWAWIICFIISVCVAIYMESGNSAQSGAGAGAGQRPVQRGDPISQSDDEAMMQLLQSGQGCVHPMSFATHAHATRPAAPAGPSHQQQQQIPPPKYKSQPAQAQGRPGILASDAKASGAQVVTATGSVFNQDQNDARPTAAAVVAGKSVAKVVKGKPGVGSVQPSLGGLGGVVPALGSGGGGLITADNPTTGGAQLVTEVGGVFNADPEGVSAGGEL